MPYRLQAPRDPRSLSRPENTLKVLWTGEDLILDPWEGSIDPRQKNRRVRSIAASSVVAPRS